MSAKRVAYFGALLALALILGLVETLLPPIFPALPYARLGLANVAILLSLLWFGLAPSALILVLKCVLLGIFAGVPSMILYSLAGGTLALLGMYALILLGGNGLPAISAVGGILHNIGQILVAIAITNTVTIAVVLPYLMLFGSVAGILTGLLAYIIIRRIKIL